VERFGRMQSKNRRPRVRTLADASEGFRKLVLQDSLVRFPRGSLVGFRMRRTDLASDFGIGEALSDYVRGNVLETKSIVGQFAEVEAEYLLVQVPEQMEGFHAHIGALDSALKETPEVFEPVSVNLPVNVLL